MWRRFFIIMGILLALGAAFIAALQSERVALALRWRLEAFATGTLKQPVHIGALSMRVLPPSITLEDIAIRADSPSGAPWLLLKRARIAPYPWPSASGAPVLGDVELNGLTLAHDIDLTSALVPRRFVPHEQVPLRLPIDIYSLRLTDSDLIVRLSDNTLRLQGVNVTIHTSRVHGRLIDVNIMRGEVHAPGAIVDQAMPFSVRAQARLAGSFDHPRGLHVDSLQGSFPGLRINANGDVALDAKSPTLALTTRAEADLATVCDLLPNCPGLSGHATVNTNMHGPAGRPDLNIQLDAQRLVIARHRIGDVKLESEVTSRGVSIDAWRIVHPDGGSSTGSGSVAWDAPHTLQFSTRLHDASLPQVLASCGLPDAWVRMVVNGDIDGSGTLTPFGLTLVTDLETQNFQVLDHPYSDPNAFVMLGIPQGAIRGEWQLDKSHVALDGVKLMAGASQVTIDGTLGFGLLAGMNLRVASDALELKDLGPIAGVDYAGRSELGATVEGPYNDPSIACTVQAAGLTIHHYDLGDTSATLIYRYPALIIDRFTTQHGEGDLSGAGKLTFGKARTSVEGAIEMENLALHDLLTTLSLPALAKHFDANVRGRVLFSGPLSLPSGVASLNTDHLVADSVALGGMEFEGTFGDAQTLAAGTLTLHMERGVFNTHAEWHNDETLALQAHVEDVPLTLVTPFLGDVPLLGALWGDVDLHGAPEKLAGELTVRVRDFVAYNVNLGLTDLRARAADSDLKVSGTLLGGILPVTGDIGLGKRLPFSAEVKGKRVPVDQLWNLGADVGLNVTGAVRARGDFTRPDSLVADAQLSDLATTWRGLSLQSVQPVHARFAEGSLVLDPTQMRGAHVGVSLSGQLPREGSMELKLRATGDLAAITAMNAQVVSASGPFDISVLVGGTLDKPQIHGDGDVKRGSMHLSQSEQIVDNINTHVVFTGRTIAVQHGSASLGGGTLRFSGEAQLGGAPGRRSEMNVHASLAAVDLRPYTDLETTLSGDLQLVGPSNDLQLKGLLHVDSLRYTARMELDRLIPKRDAAPLRVPSLQAGQVVHLGVKLQGGNNIIISSTVLEAELQADLTLTGTLEHPGLLGNITPLWARARYRDNLFKVTRASIDFIDEYRVFTEFQLQAKTTACNIQADVSIQGNSDSYTVTPYGQDEHGLVDSQDVLTCLQFGLRLHDFDGNQQRSAGISDALPGGLDALWTVSGLDDKVRKLLPIAVDELRLTSGWSSMSQKTTARVLVGKELTPQVALKYSRSLDEYNDQSFSVEYKLNDKATMQGTWLTARDVPVGDFGVDLRLHWELQ